MKILVPYRDVLGRSIDDPVTSGGIERFIRHLRDKVEGVETIDVTAKYYGDPEGMVKDVAVRALEMEADLIICNYPNEWLNTRLEEFVSIPVLWVCHHTAGLSPTAGDAVRRMKEHQRRGNKLWMVSDRQSWDWKDFGIEHLAMINPDGVIPPSFVTHVVPHSSSCDHDLVALGRCDPLKDPFMVHRVAADSGFSSLVITSHLMGAYADSNLHWRGRQVTMWDLTDELVSSRLSRCSVFFVTWPDETFGIAALEALAHGLPLVINSRGTGRHACLDLILGCQWIVSPKDGDFKSSIDALSRITEEERKKLSEYALSIHGVSAWRKKAKEMIAGAVNR